MTTKHLHLKEGNNSVTVGSTNIAENWLGSILNRTNPPTYSNFSPCLSCRHSYGIHYKNHILVSFVSHPHFELTSETMCDIAAVICVGILLPRNTSLYFNQQ
jgi:hypothetical protein